MIYQVSDYNFLIGHYLRIVDGLKSSLSVSEYSASRDLGENLDDFLENRPRIVELIHKYQADLLYMLSSLPEEERRDALGHLTMLVHQPEQIAPKSDKNKPGFFRRILLLLRLF